MINTIILATCQLISFAPDQGLHVCKYTCDQGPKTVINVVSNNSNFICQRQITVNRWLH